jgi:small subunit ribosomal protein S8
MSNFLLANLISSIRVGILGRKSTVTARNTRLNISILNLLLNLGYIRGFRIDKNNYKIEIFLKYIQYKSAIRQLYIMSRPAKPLYLKKKNIFLSSLNNANIQNGFLILSTTRGILTDVEAYLLGIGGVPLI